MRHLPVTSLKVLGLGNQRIVVEKYLESLDSAPTYINLDRLKGTAAEEIRKSVKEIDLKIVRGDEYNRIFNHHVGNAKVWPLFKNKTKDIFFKYHRNGRTILTNEDGMDICIIEGDRLSSLHVIDGDGNEVSINSEDLIAYQVVRETTEGGTTTIKRTPIDQTIHIVGSCDHSEDVSSIHSIKHRNNNHSSVTVETPDCIVDTFTNDTRRLVTSIMLRDEYGCITQIDTTDRRERVSFTYDDFGVYCNGIFFFAL